MLLHRARFLRDSFRVPPDRFRIVVFTNVLSGYIRSALDLLDIPQECVGTFDDWCRKFYETNVGKKLPWNKAAKRPDFDSIRAGVLKYLNDQKAAAPLFDFVLVDEGQDLDADCFELLKRVSRHVTVCMDHNQQIYDGGSSDGEILGALGLKRRNISFLETFRCCPYIVQVAAQYIEDESARAAYVQQTKTAQTDIETPLLYHAANFEDEKRKLLEIVKLRMNKGERIAVLLPMQRQVYGFGHGRREAGVGVEIQGDDLDFGTDSPKVMTYHSAKGLTFDTVLLPRLTARSFPKSSDARIERLLFVGITRAVRWAYLSTTQAAPFEPLIRLEALASAKKLVGGRPIGELAFAILHQGPRTDLKGFATHQHSETARRLTNLFERPKPVEVGGRIFEDGLIHRTVRNELVRSKSEVIIADRLASLKVEYAYERELRIESTSKFPDFTIEDAESGRTFYWEHCGMLHVPSYKRRWEEKLRWYRSQGIVAYEDGNGPRGTLIVTRDDERGGISSADLDRIIRKVVLGQT